MRPRRPPPPSRGRRAAVRPSRAARAAPAGRPRGRSSPCSGDRARSPPNPAPARRPRPSALAIGAVGAPVSARQLEADARSPAARSKPSTRPPAGSVPAAATRPRPRPRPARRAGPQRQPHAVRRARDRRRAARVAVAPPFREPRLAVDDPDRRRPAVRGAQPLARVADRRRRHEHRQRDDRGYHQPRDGGRARARAESGTRSVNHRRRSAKAASGNAIISIGTR